jgi:glycosyltransferase involved in cell wall biosynthesis
MRLLYFTASYPYGLGEEWKKNELVVLRNFFEEIIVIPFHYGNNFNSPRLPIEGVTYIKPLFDSLPSCSPIKEMASIFSSSRTFFYLTVLFKEKAYRNYFCFRQWLSSASLIENTRKKQPIIRYFFQTDQKTIAYFFWGRKTSEIIPLLGNPKVRTVIKFHRYDLYHYDCKTGYLPFQSFQVKFANLLLPISEDGLEYLKNRYPIASEKLKISRLGTKSEGMSKPSQDGILRLFSCSSLKSVKRVHLVAEALSRIKKHSIIWTHIGGGPEINKIDTILEKAGPNIRYTITGWVSPEKVKSYYLNQYADLFLNVSESEGIPVSIMEACSAGIPVFATSVGGTPEIVNSKNGKLLPVDFTPEFLANEIINFLELPGETISEMRRSAFEVYQEKFNAERNAYRLGKQLEELAKGL